MPAPVVAAASGGNTVSPSSTVHAVNLPTGIVSGNLLIVNFVSEGAVTIDTPSGWTALHTGTTAGNAASVKMMYKIASGSEGATLNVNVQGAWKLTAWSCARITGHHASTAPVTSAGTTGNFVTSNDPDSLTPAWGSAETLWLACLGYDNGQRWVTVYPTNYTNIETSGSGGTNSRSDNGAGCGSAIARRALTAASENPGAFTTSDQVQSRIWTVAIRPAPSALPRSRGIVIV